jgi:hypothetical protein
MDFKALDPNPSNYVVCRCGNVRGAWIDPQRGTMKVKALWRDDARVIGIHNGFLQFAYSRTEPIPDHEWRAFHEIAANSADGYLFHKDRRDCMFLILRVGESSDTFWEEDLKDNSDVPAAGTASED